MGVRRRFDEEFKRGAVELAGRMGVPAATCPKMRQGQTGLLFSGHFCDLVIDDAPPIKTLSPQQFYNDHVRQPLNHCIQKDIKKAGLVMSLPPLARQLTAVAKGR